MKAYSILAVLAIVGLVASCSKDQGSPYGIDKGAGPARKVRFELYTNEDFSASPENIQFGLTITNAGKSIFDSSLATMRIADIPDSAHRIVIEKLVPGNNMSTLVVGFVYQIENVGNSWYLETFPAGDTLKVLRYSFR